MSQLTLDAAEFAVEEAVAVHWSKEVRLRFDALVRAGLPFTSDDLRDALPENLSGGRVNLIGELFKDAAQARRITGSGRWVKSERPEARGRRIQVWHPVR
jgi:hypothetical protein